ncbi:MAG: isochorismatase family protein, partial [Blastocatellia bacterium]|nr:isochorismatase family protein [Blastocatellia bacterium]
MNTALLVIDVQAGIIDYPAYNTDMVLANIGYLLSSARTAKIPVIYIRHAGGQGDPLEANTAGWQIHRAIAPLKGEPIVDKRSCS